MPLDETSWDSFKAPSVEPHETPITSGSWFLVVPLHCQLKARNSQHVHYPTLVSVCRLSAVPVTSTGINPFIKLPRNSSFIFDDAPSTKSSPPQIITRKDTSKITRKDRDASHNLESAGADNEPTPPESFNTQREPFGPPRTLMHSFSWGWRWVEEQDSDSSQEPINNA